VSGVPIRFSAGPTSFSLPAAAGAAAPMPQRSMQLRQVQHRCPKCGHTSQLSSFAHSDNQVAGVSVTLTQCQKCGEFGGSLPIGMAA